MMLISMQCKDIYLKTNNNFIGKVFSLKFAKFLTSKFSIKFWILGYVLELTKIVDKIFAIHNKY